MNRTRKEKIKRRIFEAVERSPLAMDQILREVIGGGQRNSIVFVIFSDKP